jgi:hypothetical protein
MSLVKFFVSGIFRLTGEPRSLSVAFIDARPGHATLRRVWLGLCPKMPSESCAGNRVGPTVRREIVGFRRVPFADRARFSNSTSGDLRAPAAVLVFAVSGCDQREPAAEDLNPKDLSCTSAPWIRLCQPPYRNPWYRRPMLFDSRRFADLDRRAGISSLRASTRLRHKAGPSRWRPSPMGRPTPSSSVSGSRPTSAPRPRRFGADHGKSGRLSGD